MDKFYEISVASPDTKKYNLWNNVFIVSIFAALFAYVMNPIFGIIAAVVFVLPAFLVKRKAYVEYDYEFNSGELTISAIYEKKRRKEIGTIFLKDIQIMAPINSEDLKRFNNATIKKCYNKVEKNRMEYSMVVKWESKMVNYQVTIDKQMLDLCFFANPQNVKRQ